MNKFKILLVMLFISFTATSQSIPQSKTETETTEQQLNSGFNLYPNPVTGDTLYISSNTNLVKNVQMFDMMGKKVLEVTTTIKVDISTLKAGIYLVKITEAGKTVTRKIIVK